jgi:hypothetical protein
LWLESFRLDDLEALLVLPKAVARFALFIERGRANEQLSAAVQILATPGYDARSAIDSVFDFVA